MTPANRRVLTVAVLVGLAASTVSTYVHHQLLTKPGYLSFCDINDTVNCTQVYLSRYGRVSGIPVAFLGMVWFALSGVLIAAGPRGPKSFQENVPAYLFALSTLALAGVLYLGYASFVVLNAVCLLCVTVYAAVVGIFLASGAAMSFPMSALPERALRDLRRLMGAPAALAVVSAFVVATVAGGAWVTPSARPEPEMAAAAISDDEREEFLRWWQAQPRVDLPISNDGAKVLVVKFNDYMCPPCRQTYYGYQGIFARYATTQPGAVKLVTKHFPLDPECNASSPNGVHVASCEAAAAVQLAKRTDQDARMEAWLFENQATLSPGGVRAAAREVAGIEDFDAEYAATLEQIKADIALGTSLGVEATPTFVINGVRVTGGLTVPYFEAAIAYELERASDQND